MKSNEQYWEMDAIDAVTAIIQRTAGITDAMGRRTPIMEVIGEIGAEQWLKVYDRMEEIFGAALWEGMNCYCLGDLCDRIEELRAQRMAAAVPGSIHEFGAYAAC